MAYSTSFYQENYKLIMNMAAKSVLKRPIEPTDYPDFQFVSSYDKSQKWIMYKNKTVGYVTVKSENFFSSLTIHFYPCENKMLDEFIAAVAYEEISSTEKGDMWWIRHCVIENGVLCVVGDEENEPSGWDIEGVLFWKPWVEPPVIKN